MAYLANVLVFASGCSRYRERSQRDLILTVSVCGAMTLCSLPFFADWLAGGGSLAAVKPRTQLAETACVGLMSYMIADLSLGVLFYRERLLLGWHWIHHTIFVFILSFAVTRNLGHFFVVASMMELPIYLMFLGFLEPSLRNDYLTVATVFILRIVFHIALLVQWCLPSNRLLLRTGPGIYQWVPALLAIAAVPGHVQLLQRSIARIIRKSK
ncbi:hypothetical protein CALVIDRAFT_481871 [Calocera viscosa TUFC12733]|uniref:TLC domain-containing protein n=1 Tax=Calocera viscosa (strain TUFC12733) TaxID=1330018 RepID=A0A167LVN5_CALVF|nr:hypothetical protein CALVIDRAFT_481871 [Calocera viscosa TUFC12733]